MISPKERLKNHSLIDFSKVTFLSTLLCKRGITTLNYFSPFTEFSNQDNSYQTNLFTNFKKRGDLSGNN